MFLPTIVENLYNSAEVHQDAVALLADNRQYSYREFVREVEKAASAIDALGLRFGNRVALMLPNIPEFAFLYFGLLRQGLEVIPINIMLKALELRYILEDSEAQAIIAWDRFADQVLAAVDALDNCKYQLYIGQTTPVGGLNLGELLDDQRSVPPLSPVQEDDHAVIFYTAGTSGHPKGAVLSHGNLTTTVRGIWETFLFTSADRVLAFLPLFHSFGQIVTLNVPIAAGATVILHPRFDIDAVIEAIATHRVTALVGVPNVFDTLLSRSPAVEKMKSLRVCISSGAPLAAETYHILAEKYNIPTLAGYGLTECSPLVTCNRIYRENKTDTVGLPLPEIELGIFNDDYAEMQVGETGEIGIRGPSVMKYYLNRSEATKSVLRDGWLMTGDIGMIDPDGYLHLVDRKKDLILKSGFSIYPSEIETILLAHPKIQFAAVVGVKDAMHGEEIKAFVVLKPGESCSVEELRGYCKDKMAVYKCPKFIECVADLPRGSTGKVLKRELKK